MLPLLIKGYEYLYITVSLSLSLSYLLISIYLLHQLSIFRKIKFYVNIACVRSTGGSWWWSPASTTRAASVIKSRLWLAEKGALFQHNIKSVISLWLGLSVKVGKLVGLSFCHSFLKGREVKTSMPLFGASIINSSKSLCFHAPYLLCYKYCPCR